MQHNTTQDNEKNCIQYMLIDFEGHKSLHIIYRAQLKTTQHLKCDYIICINIVAPNFYTYLAHI